MIGSSRNEEERGGVDVELVVVELMVVFSPSSKELISQIGDK